MEGLVCNYALIRFLPYRETGEFVNIGVTVYAPETSRFDFRLVEKRNERVEAFFPELDSAMYAAAVDSLRRELERQKVLLQAILLSSVEDGAGSEGLTAFHSLLRRRESLLHFAEPGVKLGDFDQTLEWLHAEYVLRRRARRLTSGHA